MHISHLSAHLSSLDADIREEITSAFDLQQQKIQILEEQLRKVNRLHFGRSGERYDDPGQQCICTQTQDAEVNHAV